MDLVSDMLLVIDYLGGETLEKIVNDFNDTLVANVTSAAGSRTCTPLSETHCWTCDVDNICFKTESYTFSCLEYQYNYGSLTMVFIYAPCANVMASVLGPVGALFSAGWGLMLVLMGAGVGAAVGVGVLTWFLLYLGGIMFFMGMVHAVSYKISSLSKAWSQVKQNEENWMWLFIVPLIIAVSPLIMVVILTQALLHPDSQFIQSQKKLCKSGESILEATPQFCLQLFLVMMTMNPTWTQNFAIASSALSIPASNVEKFLESKQLELGLNSPSFKAFIVLFLNGLFRVVSLAILMEFFEPFALICIAANLIMLLVCSVICFYEWIGCVIFEFLESSVLGILTVTHLGPSRSAALLRLMSSYSFFFLYSIILIVIAAICNTNPESVVIPLFNIVWSELAIVQQISYLNLAIISTITSGLLSLLLDLMLACCNKSEDGSWGWNETILHEWVSRRTQQEEDPNIQTQRVERSSDGIEDDSSIEVIHIDEQYNTNM